ncbi:MAG: protein-S-isoprenylcysteine O-methyltransferase [Acidobacteriota bacterium]
MSTLVLKIIYVAFMALSVVIRQPFVRATQNNEIVKDRKTGLEKFLLALVSLGSFFVPMVYVLTPLLNFANYSLPVWANGLGVVVFAVGMWLFWRSHSDLGRNWSVTLEVREDHTLVTQGVYNAVRHPMYTSIFLWAIGQALILMNWIAGPSGLVGFGIMFLFRVKKEEQMMREQFGADYEAYCQRTKRLVPYVL